MVKPFTKKELDEFQPEITKIMRGLSPIDKQIIIKKCLKKFKQEVRTMESQISTLNLKLIELKGGFHDSSFKHRPRKQRKSTRHLRCHDKTLGGDGTNRCEDISEGEQPMVRDAI